MTYHNTYSYILNPPHKITVALIGCGGTGSQVLSILARMDLALQALGHLGLHVTVFDNDTVSDANIGRQLFSASEIGLHKSVALVNRINRFYGNQWHAETKAFNDKTVNRNFNIYITCVDDFNTRLKIASLIKHTTKQNHEHAQYYWLDFGNTNHAGQAILGTLNAGPDKKEHTPLPTFIEFAKNYKPPRKTKNTPSCSLAEALEKQDLLINSTLANAGMQLLWRLFRHGRTPYRGVILNLETLTSNPIKI